MKTAEKNESILKDTIKVIYNGNASISIEGVTFNRNERVQTLPVSASEKINKFKRLFTIIKESEGEAIDSQKTEKNNKIKINLKERKENTMNNATAYATVNGVQESLEGGEKFTVDEINEAILTASKLINAFMWGGKKNGTLSYFSRHELTIKGKAEGYEGVYLEKTTLPVLAIKQIKVNGIEKPVKRVLYLRHPHRLHFKDLKLNKGDNVEILGVFGYDSIPPSVKVSCEELAKLILRKELTVDANENKTIEYIPEFIQELLNCHKRKAGRVSTKRNEEKKKVIMKIKLTKCREQ